MKDVVYFRRRARSDTTWSIIGMFNKYQCRACFNRFSLDRLILDFFVEEVTKSDCFRT